MHIQASLKPKNLLDKVEILPSLVLDTEEFPEVPKAKKDNLESQCCIKEGKINFQIKISSLSRDHNSLSFRIKLSVFASPTEGDGKLLCYALSDPLNIISKNPSSRKRSNSNMANITNTHEDGSSMMEPSQKRAKKPEQLREINDGLDQIQLKIRAITSSLSYNPISAFVGQYLNSDEIQRKQLANAFASYFPSQDLLNVFLNDVSICSNKLIPTQTYPLVDSCLNKSVVKLEQNEGFQQNDFNLFAENLVSPSQIFENQDNLSLSNFLNL